MQDLSDDSGFKNEALHLTDEQILDNIQVLQNESNIHPSSSLVAPMGRCSLDIEMETGTGKTYVYIKTLFELNKRYGWSKFIVVVPSIAIREGVKKSFEITADHFMEHYGRKARFFIYNSSNLNQLDSFSSNSSQAPARRPGDRGAPARAQCARSARGDPPAPVSRSANLVVLWGCFPD